MSHKTLAQETDTDSKRWMIEGAANTMRDFARISKDPELVAAAQKEIDRDIEDGRAAKGMINKMNEKTSDFQTNNP